MPPTPDSTSSSASDTSARIAIAIVSLALLLFEILITRVLSVALAYHFAFLAVSLAMLGLGAPGAWFSLRPPGPHALRRALIASALALPLTLLAIAQVGAALRNVTSFWVACVLVPLIALGSVVCLLLLRADASRVGAMYGADLAGASLGALLAVPLLHGIPTPSVLAGLGVLPLIALGLLDPSARRGAVAGAVVIAASAVWGAPYALHYTHYYVEKRPPLYERWTPTARITVSPGAEDRFFRGWGLGRNAPVSVLPHMIIDQDGSANTPMLQHERGAPIPDALMYDVTSVAYQFGTPRTACIIGSGGGRDVLTALAAGARQVEAVELNPYTVDAVSRVFASYSGDPYHAPGVHAFAEEGRSHFRRSKVVCDVLQISQIDTFAASAAGAYALAENSLYTVEAIQEFWSKLSDDGVLSITRWVAGPARFESMRLVLLELEALMRQGIADPRNYLVVTQGRSSASIMLFKRPPDAARLAQIAAAEQRRGFLRLWPIGPNDPIVNGVTYTLLHGPAELEKLGLDMSPSTDDRPFFFQTLSLSASLLPERDGRTSQRQESVALLPRLLLIMIAVTFGLLILPFLLRGRLPHGPQVRRGSVFFVAIGLGFMFVEIPLIQRLALYLGHPSYATTVALGSLLLGAGLGSMLSARVPEARRRTVVLATALSIAVVIIPLTGPLSAATLHWELWARVVVTAVCVSFVGLFLGMPFALGLSCFDGRERSWFWAINAAAGVLASVLALVLSIALGFQIVTLAALLCYFVAALALPARAA